MLFLRDRRCLAKGTRHQGEFEGGGAQCTCVAYVFICLKSSGNMDMESSAALDDIVEHGTTLYFSLVHSSPDESSAASEKSYPYLMINELPETALIRGLTYNVTKISPVYTGLIGGHQSDISALHFTVNDAISEVFLETTSCFLTLGRAQCAYTIAIVKTGDNFLCFDSHSRTDQGTRTNNGTSVLLEVAGEPSLAAYINDMAGSLFAEIKETPFEFTPVRCTSSCKEQGQSIIHMI